MNEKDEASLQAALEVLGTRLASALVLEGFLNFRVSFYPAYPVSITPSLAERLAKPILRPALRELKRHKAWVTHCSLVLEDGFLRIGYETTAGDHWESLVGNFDS